ncbi:spore coat protein [Lysinibacillus piscis]|uniref:Spore coat protein F-like protein YhcQ n=1 Tax=Lysinibacillus piscis TaxID=2518931 RepID=A0ABQ5NNK3_9BACI|nr:spore coat protein [Lysinibacillus sp. KH24]GLC89825.1 spore coat protein F-like protein YhcQ [Lysinibacillus sp. KH24]
MSQSFHNETSGTTSFNQQQSCNHGGHELMDMHEAIGTIISAMNHAIICRPHVKSPELLNILDRQYNFTLGMYNTIVEAFRTGHDPSVPTGRYQMETGNQFKYGLQAGQPKTPMQNANELNDETVSGFLLGAQKGMATAFTAAATETTNPVVRRVVADSIPNCIEMAYELSIYQNQQGFYQVPQYSPQDMQALLNEYGTTTNPLH